MPHNSVLETLYPSYSSFLSSFSILFLMYQQLIASDTIFFFFQCDAILKKSESMSNKLLKKGPNCGAIAGPLGPQ